MTESVWISDEVYRAVAGAEQDLGAVRRRLDKARRPLRDLVAEIQAALADGPLTVPELGEAVHARHSDIRHVLGRNPERFERVQNAPGRSRKAKCWINAPRASVTRPGTSAESLEERRA